MGFNGGCSKCKFIALSAYVKKELERFHISNLIAHLKDLKQKEEITPESRVKK